MKLGRNLARTFLDYYKLQNYIVFNPNISNMPKLNNLKNTTEPALSHLYTNKDNNSTHSSMSSNNQYGNNNGTSNSKTSKRSSSNLSQSLKPLNSSIAINSTSSMANLPQTSTSLNVDNSNQNNNSTSPNAASKSPKFFIDNS